MAKKESQEKFKTMIGGQALLEGIMMMGPDKCATVVRSKDGLQTKIEPRKKPKEGFSVKKIPFVRGIFNFCASMKQGVESLMYSADFFVEEEEEEGKKPSKLDAWLDKHLTSNVITTIAVIFGLLFSVALFFILPSFIGELIAKVVNSDFVRNLLEGLVRILILLTYMFLVSRMKDMKRTFAYHGAEHKTIRCYEAKLPLTVENVRAQTRLHPRCGTSFLFVVVFISVLVFSVASALLDPILPTFSSGILNALLRVGLKLLLLPLVVGIGYEFNRLVGRYDNWFTRVLSAPGMWLQYMTTNEPDDSMIEVGIAALSAVVPEEEGADQW